MDKKKLEKAMRLSVNRARLTDNREQHPLEWLLTNRLSSGYSSNLEMLKSSILCMYEDHPNRVGLTKDDPANVSKLLERPDIVDIVIVSIFQWFGTNVGRSSIGKLLDEIRAMKYEEQEI